MAFLALAAPAFVGGLVTGFLKPSLPFRKGKRGEGFVLWPELAKGKHEVLRMDLCTVLLMDDTNYPCWLVLVPQRKDIKEVIDLSDKDQRKLWEEVSHVCRAVRRSFEPGLKLNIAAIGNVVAQLHVHITLRSPKDPSWPGPCYGAVPPKAFTPEALEQMLEKLNTALH
ncbi:g3094 [Coccomyxa viridis]|uniref:G3094 protein n=1 Tax=Coccomyxa viridis TaxID=1274662 RepID=A0ABP1FLZ1_9CHLO